MKKQTWYVIWLFILITASILLYPYAYKAFAQPTLTVYVIDPMNHKPILDGRVYLYNSSEMEKGTGHPLGYLQLRNGKVTFKHLPNILLGVSFNKGNYERETICDISIGRHDGNVKMYLYYNDNTSKVGENGFDLSDPLDAIMPSATDTMMTAPNPAESEATNDDTHWEKDYSVQYDQMRVRDKPELNGKILATLQAGDLVSFYGEKSDNKSLITIKGQPILSTWMKVKTKNGVTGWMVSCALQEYFDPSWD
jgi:hypothetical protein